MADTVLQHWIVIKFILPFLLVWVLIFAILQKTKLLGDDKKQLDAILALVIAAIFVGIFYNELVISNLILFLTISIIVMFIALLLWGFLTGEEARLPENKGLKIIGGIAIIIAVTWSLFWAMGIKTGIFNLLFKQAWSNAFWTNILFIIVIAAVLAFALKSK